MTRFLHSNRFFVLSLVVIVGWLATLIPGPRTVRIVECPYRVSERGVVHGPDSPYWGLTAADPCFSSKHSAREYTEREIDD